MAISLHVLYLSSSSISTIIFIYFSSSGTRLRAPERILNNLRGQDEIEIATQAGYSFPSQTSEQLQQAIQAMMVPNVESFSDAEEIVTEWDVDIDEPDMSETQ